MNYRERGESETCVMRAVCEGCESLVVPACFRRLDSCGAVSIFLFARVHDAPQLSKLRDYSLSDCALEF